MVEVNAEQFIDAVREKLPKEFRVRRLPEEPHREDYDPNRIVLVFRRFTPDGLWGMTKAFSEVQIQAEAVPGMFAAVCVDSVVKAWNDGQAVLAKVEEEPRARAFSGELG